jgi:hypothetical protein
LAVGGDVQAAKVWLDHVVGKAPASVEHSGKVETSPRGVIVVVEDNGRPIRPPLNAGEDA